jgi:hypothetical protein
MDRSVTLEFLLKHRHAELPLFLLRMQNTDRFRGFSEDEGKNLFREHLLYWWELEDRGNLLGAGPVNFGTPLQEGLAILIAPSHAVAMTLAEGEPFHRAGWRTNSVQAWQLNEGLMVSAVSPLVRAVSAEPSSL